MELAEGRRQGLTHEENARLHGVAYSTSKYAQRWCEKMRRTAEAYLKTQSLRSIRTYRSELSLDVAESLSLQEGCASHGWPPPASTGCWSTHAARVCWSGWSGSCRDAARRKLKRRWRNGKGKRRRSRSLSVRWRRRGRELLSYLHEKRQPSGCLFSWRWAESNRRPNNAPESFLHAYSSFGCRPRPAEGRASRGLSSESWRGLEVSVPCIRF